MASEQKLRPLMSEAQLCTFFEDRLPHDLPIESYRRGLSCLGFARLITDYHGGPSEARIFFISRLDPQLGRIGHAYVAPIDLADSKLAFGNYYPTFGCYTIGSLRRNGRDITSMIFAVPWDNLVLKGNA